MKSKNLARVALGLAAVAFALVQAATASIITTDPSLPPTSGDYTESGPVIFNAGAFSIVFSGLAHSLQAGTVSSSASGGNEFETFQSTLTGEASVNGGTSAPFQLTGPVQTEVFGRVGDALGTFNTQMLQLDLTGNVGGQPVMIRVDPITPTLGQTSISDAGGGMFQINSFFDVFTYLSIDGGNTWIPQVNGPTVVTLQAVPEPTTVPAGSLLLLPLCVTGYRIV